MFHCSHAFFNRSYCFDVRDPREAFFFLCSPYRMGIEQSILPTLVARCRVSCHALRCHSASSFVSILCFQFIMAVIRQASTGFAARSNSFRSCFFYLWSAVLALPKPCPRDVLSQTSTTAQRRAGLSEIFTCSQLCRVQGATPPAVLAGTAAGVALQVAVAAPFLANNAAAYVGKAFELSRVFLRVWSVNLKFLPEEVMTDCGRQTGR
jgi:ALG3 protein